MPSDWAAPWVPWSQGRKAGVEEGRAAELNRVLLQGVGWARQESWSQSVGGRGWETGVGLRAGGQAGGVPPLRTRASSHGHGKWTARRHRAVGPGQVPPGARRLAGHHVQGPQLSQPGLRATDPQTHRTQRDLDSESHSVVSTCVTSASHPTLSPLLGLGVQGDHVRLPAQPEALLAACRARALGPGCPTMWPGSCCHSKWL